MRGGRRILVVLAAAAPALAPGCGRESAPDPGAAARALAEAEKLAARHRLAEALAVAEAALPGRTASPAPVAGPELALRRRRGTLLLSLGRAREAAAVLEEVSRLGPDDPAARRWLAQAYLESGACEEAARTFAALPGPLAPEVLVALGNALAGAGRAGEGAHAIAAALARDPWLDAGYLALGRALARRGRAELGKAFLERYRATDGLRRAEQEVLAFEAAGDTARALQRRARLERQRGRLFTAMELHNRALKTNPGLGEAYFDLARLSIFLARPGDAVRVLEGLPRDPRVLEVLAEAREAAPATGGEERPATEPERLRREIAGRIQGKPLSRCAGDLLPLAGALSRAGRGEEARGLALFLVRLEPGNREARLAFIALHDRSDEAFLRLWALDPERDPEAARQVAAEAAALDLDAEALRSFLGRAARASEASTQP